nr:MAG TPA: hypothetical protein [Caudoviricetes sp.]
MINKKFETYKVRRELKKSGANFVFYRKGLNQFNEKSDVPIEVANFDGLYHEQTKYIKLGSESETRLRTEKEPMILCLFSEQSLKIKIDDEVKINDKTYKVTGTTNLNNWNILIDISLEVVDDGKDPV